MKKYQGVLYDIDGTILDTLEMNLIPLLKIIEEELQEKWTFQQVLPFAAYPGMKVMEALKIQDKKTTYARWVKYVNEYEAGAKVYPEVEHVLEMLAKKGIFQGVVSAKTKKQYQLDMVGKGLDKYMKVAILFEDTKEHKPHPAPLLKAIQESGLKKEELLYLGDASSDYQAAKQAQIDFGYAKWGKVAKEEFPDATYTFITPKEILKLF